MINWLLHFRNRLERCAGWRYNWWLIVKHIMDLLICRFKNSLTFWRSNIYLLGIGKRRDLLLPLSSLHHRINQIAEMLNVCTKQLRSRLSIESERGSCIWEEIIRGWETMGISMLWRSVSWLSYWFAKSQKIRAGADLNYFWWFPSEGRGTGNFYVLIVIIQPTTILPTH